MKLQNLTVNARGRNHRVDFRPGQPVTVLSGPNGAGKSTVLTGLQLALSGVVTVDGKARKTPGDVFAHLSTGAAVGTYATFDCGQVARTFTRNAKGETSQDVTFSGAPGAKKDACQQAIAEQIGDLARVDVADLLSKGPTDRRASVLRLCRQLAKPWSMADLKAAFDAAAQQATGYDADAAPVFTFTVDRERGLLGSCEAHEAAAGDAVKEATARIKSLQQAIDRMAEQTAESATAGDSDAMAARIAALNAEVERITAEVSSIESGNRSAEIIERRLGDLAALPPVEKAQTDLDAVRAALADAEAKRAALVAPVAPVEPADLAEMRKELRNHQELATTARATRAAAERRIEALRDVLAHTEDCPTCARPIDDDAADAINLAISALDMDARGCTFAIENATSVTAVLAVDIEDAEIAHAEALKKYEAARASHSRAEVQAEADVANTRYYLADAEVTLKRAQTADAERAELRAQLAKIATGDAEMLRMQIQGAARERTDLQRRRDAVLASDATQAAYRTHIADRDELVAKLPGLKVAAEAWRQVVNEVAESAVRPFLDACNAALPAGWSMDFDPSTADFRVGRGDLWVVFSALSGGERVMATAAMAVALASTAGNKWRAIILDDCDRIMGDAWNDPAYPAGLFAAFVERLADACRRGLVDQVLMATSRRLQGAERTAIDATGAVQVVEFSAPAGTPPPAPSTDDEPEDASEAPKAEKPLTDEQRIKRALARGVSADAMSYLLETVCGRPKPHPTAATMKRVLGDSLVAMLDTRGIDAIERQIVLAAQHHPVKVKAGEQTAEA